MCLVVLSSCRCAIVGSVACQGQVVSGTSNRKSCYAIDYWHVGDVVIDGLVTGSTTVTNHLVGVLDGVSINNRRGACTGERCGDGP